MTEETQTPESPEPARAHEAAKYRRQLRDTEAERDTLRESLRAARGEILRTALNGYTVKHATFNMDALPDAGIDTDALFTPEGTLNQDALTEHMAELATSKPYMFTNPQPIRAGAETEAALAKALGLETAFTPPRMR